METTKLGKFLDWLTIISSAFSVAAGVYGIVCWVADRKCKERET